MAALKALLTQPAQTSSDKARLMPRLVARWRSLTVPIMGILLFLYVLFHSPVRRAIAGFFRVASDTCYLACPAVPPSLSRLAEGAAGWVLIVAALAAAWPITEWFMGEPYERVVIYGLSALACVVVPAAALGGLGAWAHAALLRPPAGPLLVAAPSIVILVIAIGQGWRPKCPRLTAGQMSPLILLIGGLTVVLLSGSILLALVHPTSGGDALSYHAPLAVFLWRDGNLATFLDRTPVTWALANPGTAELWYGLLQLAGGEHLANLGQLPFALLGAVAVAAFTRRLRLNAGAARLAGLAFLLSPIVIMQSGQQPNDVLAAGLLMTTLTLAGAPTTTWTLRRVALIGLGLGLTATTKLVLLPAVAGAGLFVLGATLWRQRHEHIGRWVLSFAVLGLAFLIVVAPWWIRNISRYGNPVYPAGLPLIGRGIFVSDFGKVDTEFVPRVAAWPLYPLLEPQDDRSGFGGLFAVAVLPGFALGLFRSRHQPMLLLVCTAGVMLPAWWLLTMHEPRFWLAYAGLGFAFLPWSILFVPRPSRRLAAGLIGAAAVFSALVTVDQALLPFARQPNTRLEFYDRVWAVDPAANSLPESEGLLYHTGFAATIPEYAAYYPLLGPSLTRLVIPVDGFYSTDRIVAQMRAAGVRYAYVAAAPEFRHAVEAIYDNAHFELVHMTTIDRGEPSGARRFLYEPVTNPSDLSSTRRYLFRLRNDAEGTVS
jgi:hypothetical protein